MPSPIAHSLAGTATWAAMDRRRRIALFVLAVLVANLPDLDFLPGLLVGDANRFHHAFSHSLGALVVVSLAAAGVARLLGANVRAALSISVVAYASHLLLDMLAVDTRAPYGIPALWPLSNAYFLSPVSFFLDVRRSADPSRFWISLFSNHNLHAVLREVVILGGILLGILLARRSCKSTEPAIRGSD